MQKAIELAATRAKKKFSVVDFTKIIAAKDRDKMLSMTRDIGELIKKELGETLPDILRETIVDAGVEAGRTAKVKADYRTAAVTMSFEKTNPMATSAAKMHAGELIKDFSEEQVQALRMLMERSFVEKIAPRKTAQLMRSNIGLHEKYSDAVVNAYNRMQFAEPGGLVKIGKQYFRVPDNGFSADRVGELADRYASVLLNKRALTIARTETMRASNEGQRQLWLQATENGLLEGNEYRMWILTPDDRLCEICEQMEGALARIGDQFELPSGEKVDNPPAHPNCRCAQGLTDKVPEETKEEPPDIQGEMSTVAFDGPATEELGLENVMDNFGGGIREFAEGIGEKLGADYTTIDFSSFAAENSGAYGFFDPETRLIGFARSTSERIVAAMQGEQTAEAFHGLTSLVHEMEHATSPLLRSKAFRDWWPYFEEGMAERKARADAARIMFRGKSAPDWVKTARINYRNEVSSVEWLSKQFGDDFVEALWESTDRVAEVNRKLGPWLQEQLTAKFGAQEAAAIVRELGDDVWHTLRTGLVNQIERGSISKKSLKKVFAEDYGIQRKIALDKTVSAAEALTNYTEWGIDLNVKLRAGEELGKFESTVSRMDDLFKKKWLEYEAKGEDWKLAGQQYHRGLPSYIAEDLNFKTGSVFEDNGYLSFSKSNKYTKEFIEDSFGEGKGTYLHIFIPDQYALDVNEILGAEHIFAFQKEIIAGRNSRIMITRIEGNHIYGKLLPRKY